MHFGLYFYNPPPLPPSDLLLFLESINFFSHRFDTGPWEHPSKANMVVSTTG